MSDYINKVLGFTTEVGITVAIIMFIRYCYNHRSKISFLNAAGIVISSQAVVGGLALCYKAILIAKWDLSQSEKIYIFIGGLAVAWNAIISINRLISNRKLINQNILNFYFGKRLWSIPGTMLIAFL